MTAVDRHRLEAARLRQEAEKRKVPVVLGIDLWKHMAEMHEKMADRLDEMTDTVSDLKVIDD